MADNSNPPILGRDADGRVSSVILDVHVTADSPLALQKLDPEFGSQNPFAHYDEEAPAPAPAPAPKAAE
jgi:hypothetical protein